MTIRQQPKGTPAGGRFMRLRQPKGTPAGGRFARSRRGDDDDLMFSVPDEELTRGATDPTLASDLIGRVRAGRYDPNKPLHRFAADGSIESLDYAQLGAEAATHRAEIQRTIQTHRPPTSGATHDFDGRADRRHAPRRVRRHPGGSRPPAVGRESESQMGGCAARPGTADRRGLRRSEHECRHAGPCGPLAEQSTFRSAGRGGERQRIQKRGRIMQSQRLQHPRIPDLGQLRLLPVAQI